jgi:DNA primase large subunit
LGDSIPLGRSDLARFPFLPQARQIIGELDIDFVELGSLKNIVDRAKQRILASFALRADNPSEKVDVEIASFPVAMLVVAGVNDKTLTKRYALFEAKKMYDYLKDERDESISKIAQFFKWKKITKFVAADAELAVLKYKVHFVNYLSNATSLVHDPRWKLVNHQIQMGQVEVTKREVCRLLQEEIRKHVESKAVGKMPQIPQTIQDTIDEIKAEYLKVKPHVTEIDRIRVFAEESEYPPCIRNLYDKMIKGQHLSHVERLTLVTYLLHQGISVDAITNLFAGLSDYRRDRTRYQVEHLAGKKGSGTVYKPYNCATLRTHGVCLNPDDPICKNIKNPLSYHLRKKLFDEKER